METFAKNQKEARHSDKPGPTSRPLDQRCGKFSKLILINLENYPLPIFQNVFYPNSWITVLVSQIDVPQVCPILLFMACSLLSSWVLSPPPGRIWSSVYDPQENCIIKRQMFPSGLLGCDIFLIKRWTVNGTFPIPKG